ncbi:MAG: hypothetical protein V2I97_25500 [Desulfococcaceae bacterium]|nr:hypothetical protein [Desulfococcaceae bacterium]
MPVPPPPSVRPFSAPLQASGNSGFKDIVLVAMGAVIMSAMIRFSIQREDIMKRIRILREDLAGWE